MFFLNYVSLRAVNETVGLGHVKYGDGEQEDLTNYFTSKLWEKDTVACLKKQSFLQSGKLKELGTRKVGCAELPTGPVPLGSLEAPLMPLQFQRRGFPCRCVSRYLIGFENGSDTSCNQ